MKELARLCKRTEETVVFDKLSAAQHQIEGAIANLFLGNWPAAITLAGAAEEILPSHSTNVDFFTFVKKRAAEDNNRSEKEIADILNEQRNWLKHDQIGNPNFKATQTFSQGEAVSVIVRACSRLYAHLHPMATDEVLSENIWIFESWLRLNYADWLQSETEEAVIVS